MKANISERLYLSKGAKGDIFIDHCNLSQHQIDGIRFLYRQFQEKKPAVVLNDPPGHGKKLQVVLFLNALFKTFEHPNILILCDERSKQIWLEKFIDLTSLRDDVVIWSGGFLKNKIVIANIMDINVVANRIWSVAIVDEVTPSKEVLKYKIDAEFKIWLTTYILKSNLDTFISVQKWLNPQDDLNIKDFLSKMSDKNKVNQSIILDAYMQDFVLRRTMVISEEKYMPKVSRKNKDATGTKIKCSKRKIDEVYNNSDTLINHIVKANNITTNVCKNEVNVNTINNNVPINVEIDIKDTTKSDNHEDVLSKDLQCEEDNSVLNTENDSVYDADTIDNAMVVQSDYTAEL